MPHKLVNGVQVELTQEEIAAIEAERAARLIPNAIGKKRKEILDEYNGAIKQITAGYDDHEIASWPQQAEEARARSGNAQAPTPLIDALSAARQVETSVMVSLILQKEALFKPIFGAVLGAKQQRLAALSAIDPSAQNALELLQSV
jgi:hypothetical protein